MPTGEALDDDYIISLLQKDADEHKKRYSTIGNGPLLSAAKRRPDAPKPNTRFLKNIIRETDSHNAALKAKEEGESRARLQNLRREERAGKRKREDGDSGGRPDEKRRREVRESRPGRWASALGLVGAKDGAKREGIVGEKDRRSRRGGKDDERSTTRHGHRRERSERDEAKHSSHRSKEKHSHRPRDRSRSPSHRKEHRRRHRSRSRSPVSDRTATQNTQDADSDPLTEFLGPQPAPQNLPRGRGAFKPSNMDSRFQQGYDPSTDVSLERDEEDDWDMALEALKARTKWRTQGVDRLRAAGFTEDEVQRWEKSSTGGGGAEKDVEDVRWSKKGEGREWDRGKVLDGDDEVELKAEWAR